jgi:transcriptional regulator GlxA family with amidase domain
MKRNELIAGTAAAAAAIFAARATGDADTAPQPVVRRITPPPANKPVNVAIVVGDSATVIDFAGPWEVFQDTWLGDANDMNDMNNIVMPFTPYLVSDSKAPVEATDMLEIVPRYTFATAPQPHIVVVGAQGGRSQAKLQWLREQTQKADVVMSVCTGAFVLGAAGLLDGQLATTHHDFYDAFAKRYPKAQLVRGPRFVENEKISCAGGLSSGIELALHVVERYYGRQVADRTAYYMEYTRSPKRPTINET